MTIKSIVKRDGSLAPFDIEKISAAILKALKSSGMDDPLLSDRLAKRVYEKVFELDSPDLEMVQDKVEETLVEAKLYRPSREYILYRDQRRRAREAKAQYVDVADIIDGYVGAMDWRVNENANINHSFQGMMLHLSGTMQAKYTLEKFPERIRTAHGLGYFHIHDLSMGLTGYCAGWSLKDLLLEGFNAQGYCSAVAPKHFDVALMQMVNFLGTIQNEWAGAQAFNNIDTLLAPFIRRDGLTFDEVKQSVQKFVFNLNTTSRWGGQSPFTNITLDLHCPKAMRDEAVIICGELHPEWTYKEFQPEQDMFNQAFLEVMIGGDGKGNIFSYPIPTYNITEDFPWDSKVGRLVLELTAKYGAPYFQNFINSDMKPEDVRSMCCRLQMDLRELRKRTGGLFGSGDMTGSIGVVTLNLPKLAFLAQDEEEFFALVTEYATLAKEALEIKRKTITHYLEAGFYPFTKRYLKAGYRNHFSTIGILGGHEACLNLLDKGIESAEGAEMMQKTLDLLRDLMTDFQEETGNLFNLEATPAEGTCYRLAKIDKGMYGDAIITSGNGEPYYTNSTNLPVDHTSDPFEALMHQNGLQTRYTGGTVFHTYLGERLHDLDALKNYIIKAMTVTKLPYISITPSFSICEDHGYLSGEHDSCPTCGKPVEAYTRVTGFYRPVSRFNKGKAAEKKNRLLYQKVA